MARLIGLPGQPPGPESRAATEEEKAYSGDMTPGPPTPPVDTSIRVSSGAPPSVVERGCYPRPLAEIGGTNLLCYQDDFEQGKIIVPKAYEKRVKPTTGTIIQLGHCVQPYYMDKWGIPCPYKIGDRVVWSKWEDRGIKIDVAPGWWTEEEEKRFEQEIRPDKKVEFVIVDVDEIWGKVL